LALGWSTATGRKNNEYRADAASDDKKQPETKLRFIPCVSELGLNKYRQRACAKGDF
jgi:hypothetical protein